MSKKIVAVFGATGAQGGSVVRALLDDGTFHVRAVTRNANSDKAKQLALLNNVTVVEADLDKPETFGNVFKGAYGVFLVTDFSAHFDKRETQQGINAINSAISYGVKHFVFSSLDDAKSAIGKPCEHFDQKYQIEKYGLSVGDKINFTGLRTSVYYENLVGVSLRKTGQNEYKMNFPMEGKEFFAFSVSQTGPFVVAILKNPEEFKGKSVKVAGDTLKVENVVTLLNYHLQPYKFEDSGITAAQYAQFGFPGAEDLAAMCEYFQSGKMERDIKLSKLLNKDLQSFEEWLVSNRNTILNNLPK